MSNPLDTDAGTELFSSYEAEFKLVQADITQKLDQIPELSGEPRKAGLSQVERALEEASELVSLPSFFISLALFQSLLYPYYFSRLLFLSSICVWAHANKEPPYTNSLTKCAWKSKIYPPHHVHE